MHKRFPFRLLRQGIQPWLLKSLLFLLLIINGPQLRGLEDQTPLAAKIKVAYIYNILKFVDWPRPVDGTPNTPIRICTIGTDETTVLLKELASRTIRNRSIQVVACPGDLPPAGCQVIFFSHDALQTFPEKLSEYAQHPTLTIGDQPAFAQRGGMIGFCIEDERVRLEINLTLLRGSGLAVSAKLLEIARVIP